MTDVLTAVEPGPAGVTASPGSEGAGRSDGPMVLTCVAVTDVTHDVRSFTFELPGGAPLAFEPGQYLTLTVDVDGRPTQRCYTISSSPAERARPTITVKRVPGGPVSNALHDTLLVGGTVTAEGPLGAFSTANHPADRYLFLSAGSGITPLMSMTRALRDRARETGARPAVDVAFVHCARSPRDIIFRRELEELAEQAWLTVTVLCEDDSPDVRWTGLRGRLSLGHLLRAAPDLLDREVLTCGPPPFMAAVRQHLAAIAADPARSHEESFLLGSPGGPDRPGPGAATHTVTFRRSGRAIECDAGTTVLAAAARAGLTLASSCGEGVCGTCKVTLLAGRVDMRHAGGIRQREVDQGKVLLCCSTPLDDLEVDA